MIKINIHDKSFKQKTIFHETSITISNNEFLALKGESGIGKTTLLSMIGMTESFVGDYYVDDILINKKNRESMRINLFSYMFQKPMLIPYLTVKENILLPLKNLKAPLDEAEYQKVITILKIADLENRTIVNLSGGEANRVSLARAMMSGRKILLADEPTGSLDHDNAVHVMNSLKDLQTKYGYTIILVTHSNEFDHFYNRILTINDHQIVEKQ
ncbi:MAG: ATP-binding cassette domain-containing protein [Bacilli bacterium]